MSQVKAGAAYVELTTRNSKFLKGLEAAKKRLERFGASTRLIGTRLMSIGTAAAAPLAGSLAVFSSFDDAMRGVKAITGATAAEFEMLRDKAKRLGATTSFSASEVASLMTELGRAGFNPKQIEDMTGSVMNLARATGTDATIASGIFAAAIRQFGMEATDASRVADGLTAAANRSFNSVESLGEALSYAGPVAADANMSLEETLAILGTLGNIGIQGSSAGNALKRLLTLSAAESEKFQKVFGVATMDAAGNARPLVDVLGEVADATKNLGSAEKAAKLNEVFGLLGITSASAIGKSVTDTRALLAELKNAGGVADKTAKEMDSGIGGAFRILKSSIEGVAIAIGESLNGPITKMVQAFSRAASGLTEWIGNNRRAVQIAAVAVAAIVGIGAALFAVGTFAGIASFAIGGLVSLFSVLGTVIGFIGSAIAALFSPIGLVLVAVAALGAYFLYASGIAGKAVEYLGAVFQVLKKDTLAAFGAIANALSAGDITAASRVLWAYLNLQWTRGIEHLKGAWRSLTLTIARGLVISLEYIANAWDETIGYLADGWSVFSTYLKQRWNDATGFIRKAWIKLKSLISDIDVEVEMRKIDNETQAANRADENARNQAIAARMQTREAAARKRRAMREGINANLQGGGVDDAGRQRIDEAQSQFDAAMKAANEVGGDEAKDSEQPQLPDPNKLDVDVPKLDAPELQAPDGKDLQFGLDPNAADAINGFGSDTESVTASFDSAGMGFGNEVSALKAAVPKPGKKKPAAEAEPKLPEIADVPVADAEGIEQASTETGEHLEDSVPTDGNSNAIPNVPIVDTDAINQSLAKVNEQLTAFDASLLSGQQQVERTVASEDTGLGASIQRAIAETAENTKKLADKARDGGLVFG
ncbi:MAG: phage tail tape measure protein [Planctomycetota bacterium]